MSGSPTSKVGLALTPAAPLLAPVNTSRQLAATASNFADVREARISSAGAWRAMAKAVASPMDPGAGPVKRTACSHDFSDQQVTLAASIHTHSAADLLLCRGEEQQERRGGRGGVKGGIDKDS